MVRSEPQISLGLLHGFFMIGCITFKSAHHFRGNPIASMFQLRFRAVIERQEWDVPTWQHMEYDEFDNPATTYFVWRDEDDAVRGLHEA